MPSVRPPAGKFTTMVIGLLGQVPAGHGRWTGPLASGRRLRRRAASRGGSWFVRHCLMPSQIFFFFLRGDA